MFNIYPEFDVEIFISGNDFFLSGNHNFEFMKIDFETDDFQLTNSIQ